MKVELQQVCASDLDIVNAARVSVDAESLDLNQGDERLIRALMREGHVSPFKHGYFRFRIEAPIFVMREWMTHGPGHAYNEVSGRYVQLERKFYAPDSYRRQVGRPMDYEFVELGSDLDLTRIMRGAFDMAWAAYELLLERGVAREQARAVLPVGIYTKVIWSANPLAVMNFLKLRNAPNALKELRECAAEVERVFAEHLPVTAAAFRS